MSEKTYTQEELDERVKRVEDAVATVLEETGMSMGELAAKAVDPDWAKKSVKPDLSKLSSRELIKKGMEVPKKAEQRPAPMLTPKVLISRGLKDEDLPTKEEVSDNPDISRYFHSVKGETVAKREPSPRDLISKGLAEKAKG